MCIKSARVTHWQTGFTFIELILIVTLIILLGTMSTAFTSRFFLQNAALNASDQLAADLRQGQINAMVGKQNGNWGVNYNSTNNIITLYSGSSFATRTIPLDSTFTVPSGITITYSNGNDINFTKTSGLPNFGGRTDTITISGTGGTQTVTVNSQGVVSR